ncbi:MAG: ATP-binding protein, partial [Planctomycetota bacterium]
QTHDTTAELAEIEARLGQAIERHAEEAAGATTRALARRIAGVEKQVEGALSRFDADASQRAPGGTAEVAEIEARLGEATQALARRIDGVEKRIEGTLSRLAANASQRAPGGTAELAEIEARLGAAIERFEEEVQAKTERILGRAESAAETVQRARDSVERLAGQIAETVKGWPPPRAAADAPATAHEEPTSDGPPTKFEEPPLEAPAAGVDEDGHEDEQPEQVAELLASKQELEARLLEFAARCEELEAAPVSAISAERAKSSFLAAMPEELRAPIEGVVNVIEQLRKTDLDERQRYYLQIADSSVSALLGMVESVHDLPKMGSDEFELETKAFDLRRTLEDLVSMLSPAAEKKQLWLSCDLEQNVPARVQGDAGRLRQILLYVMNRAIKFASDGQIALHVVLEQKVDDSSVIRFRIHHEGNPLTDEQLAQIFDVEGTSESRGLGLAIAGQLVELMGGQIGVDSDAHGFTIWFTITLWSHDRRLYPRLPQASVLTNFGPVLDLSLSGARIRCSRALEGIVDVDLMASEETLFLQAEVVWTKRIGFRKYEAGLRFLEVTPDIAEQLTRVSLNHRVRVGKVAD